MAVDVDKIEEQTNDRLNDQGLGTTGNGPQQQREKAVYDTVVHETIHADDHREGRSPPEGHNDKDVDRENDRVYQDAKNRTKGKGWEIP